jgi:hypothetical protein
MDGWAYSRLNSINLIETRPHPSIQNTARFASAITYPVAFLLGVGIIANDGAQSPGVCGGMGYSFKCSEDLVLVKKPVKTHMDELFFKSNDYKGYSVGVTVSPI